MPKDSIKSFADLGQHLGRPQPAAPLGPSSSAGKCRMCGGPTKPGYDICYGCSQKRPPRGGPGPPGRPKLPEGYLNKGYADEKGNMWPELITTQARQVAEALSSSQMKTAAIRRFFGKARFIESLLDSKGGDFDAVRAEIIALEPAAEDSVKRQVSPPLFIEFIKANTKWAAQSAANFALFIKHFQYVVAYFPRE